MRHAIPLMTLGLLVLPACQRGPLPPDNMDDVQQDPQEDVLVESDVRGFFAPNEPWTIGALTYLIGGYGETIEYITLSPEDNSDICSTIDPPASIVFDGQDLSVMAVFDDVNGGRECAVDIIGNGTACLPGIAPEPGCALDEVEAVLRSGELMSTLGFTSVVRIPSCDRQLDDLGSLGEWLLLGVHPFVLGQIETPAAVGGVVTILGEGSAINGAVLATGGTDEPEGCVDVTPDGIMTLTQGQLTIDLALQGMDNDTGSGTAEACTIRFEGTAVYCAQPPGELGVLRFEGTGDWTADGETGVIDVLYLSVQPPADTPVTTIPPRM